MKKLNVLIVLLIVISCKSPEKEIDFATQVENAHLKNEFLKNEAIQFDIISYFGTNEWVTAKMTLATNSSNGKIEFKNGTQIIYNGTKVFYSKEIKDTTSIRFDAYTIPYFFLLPYKLKDQGTVWINYNNSEKDSDQFTTKKLTFESGNGDAHTDWYILYADKKTNLIQKAAYIVTAKGSVAEAEKNPHAVQYLDYKNTNQIPIATSWKFWGWTKNDGLTQELGNAKLSNIKFITTTNDFYTPSNGFLEIKN